MKLMDQQIHARIGEILFISSKQSQETIDWYILADALRRFCRSIELCDAYLRGYYGLKMVIQTL